VKRYVEEQDSSRVNGWLADGLPATARLSAIEVASALARRAREGAFSGAERDRALDALDRDLATLRVVELSTSVALDARALLIRHPLRAGDAIQLASALLLRRELGEPVAFAVYDDGLRAAAKAEGLRVLP